LENTRNRLPEFAIRQIKAMNIFMVIVVGFGVMSAYTGIKNLIPVLKANAFQGILSFIQLAGTVYALYLLINSRKLFKQFAESRDGDLFHLAMQHTAQYWKIQSLVLFVTILSFVLGGWGVFLLF
jgi:hypothetical protein